MAYKDKSKLIAYNNQYNAEKYDRVTIMLPQGEKENLKSYAAAHNESVNSFVKRAIYEAMQKDIDRKSAEI